MVRLFRDNGRDGLSFLVAQQVQYVAIGDKIELNLGQDPEVIFELVKKRVHRDNLWMQLHGANVFRRIDQMEVVHQAKSLSMAWCLECHRNPGPYLRPKTEITSMDWEPADTATTDLGNQLLQDYEVHPSQFLTNCTVCHR